MTQKRVIITINPGITIKRPKEATVVLITAGKHVPFVSVQITLQQHVSNASVRSAKEQDTVSRNVPATPSQGTRETTRPATRVVVGMVDPHDYTDPF